MGGLKVFWRVFAVAFGLLFWSTAVGGEHIIVGTAPTGPQSPYEITACDTVLIVNAWPLEDGANLLAFDVGCIGTVSFAIGTATGISEPADVHWVVLWLLASLWL